MATEQMRLSKASYKMRFYVELASYEIAKPAMMPKPVKPALLQSPLMHIGHSNLQS